MTSEIGKKIMKFVGEDFFTTEDVSTDKNERIPALCQNNLKNVTLMLIRETIAPFIDRSNMPDESIWFKMPDGREVIHVPARKFKSREKLFGIKLLRYLGKVDRSYKYNHLTSRVQLMNPTSVLMGETIVDHDKGEKTLSVPARALYSDVYSLRSREYITDKLTNNALNEQGTMYDVEKGRTSSAFFQTEFVVPGVFFPAFITLKDPTPELLLHLIFSLRQTAYGASTATTGTNFRNHIVGIIGSKIEPPISSYLVSLNYSSKDTATPSQLTTPPEPEPKGVGVDSKDTAAPSPLPTLSFSVVKEKMLSLAKETLTDGAAMKINDDLNNFLADIKSLNPSDDNIKEAYDSVQNDIEKYLSFSFDKPKPDKKKDKGKSGNADKPTLDKSGDDDSGNIQTNAS